MKNGDQQYSVKQLAALAGVSIRTLHHYDEIGLLKPASRTEKGYRYYQNGELLRLQQILFYKTLGYSLEEIKPILDKEDFDLITALQSHKVVLQERVDNMNKLMVTIDKTISELKNQEGMITDKEMYDGFSPKEISSRKSETKERWPEESVHVEKKIREMSKTAWSDTKQEGDEINLWLSNLIHKPVNDIEVQKVIQLHFHHLNKFYAVSEERYRALATMYLEDERFKAHYEGVKPGLATFLHQGIQQFCDNGMKVV